ncbi:MAG TPA: HlyD family efflux transporter periplasmic adaptor subunit [Rhodanobacteraceae bacterium]|nr:HlyD family efflux transporter periplasmic adaptor subunit [Rhodanobacteraceae bacterium]
MTCAIHPSWQRAFGACLLALALAACSHEAPKGSVTEQVEPGPLVIAVAAQGELHSTHATPLTVPGQQFTHRQLAWILPDGSRVKKGELIARFSARQSKQDLAEALVDLQRNALARAGKQSDIDSQRDKLDVGMAEVETDLGIAKRYSHASLLALSRDKILDSVQDAQFLTTKKGILTWQLGQAGDRGAAELAVIDAKRATFELNAKQKRADLDALEVRAPHAGVLVLKADWSGNTPHIGSTMWAGNSFASLPDPASLEVELWVPGLEAQGIAAGDTVELHPLGDPSQTATTKLSWVASTAQPRSRESPVKFVSMKAPIPVQAARRYGWTPGQRFAARVVLLDAKHTLSVPNLALASDNGDPVVQLSEGDRTVQRRVTLGVRGPARSQVTQGLAAGDVVLLDLSRKQNGS